MRPLPDLRPYKWAAATTDIAGDLGVDPIDIVRFDANVRATPLPSTRPAALAGTLADINNYPHGGLRDLVRGIAGYAGVEPENVVLGAGADDLILLTARAYAGEGDVVSIPQRNTYPLYRIGTALVAATVGNQSPVLTYFCRPNNPTGELDPLPTTRPLVVDEAYFEYAGESAVDRLDDEVIVLRTFSKSFGLAGARVGYALARADIAAELNARQSPGPVSRLSAALAVAALRTPPDVTPEVDERERLASELRALGLEPLPSRANFVFVPISEPEKLARALYERRVIVRTFDDGIRISVRDRHDDNLLLSALSEVLDRPQTYEWGAPSTVRHVRTTVESTVRVRLTLCGSGLVHIATGSGIYDHFLHQLAFNAGVDVLLETVGDHETGPHHSVEDSCLALGEALDRALGSRRGLNRYGHAVVPMDEARAEASVDLGGRPWSEIDIDPEPGLARHALASWAQAARLALHVTASGRDDHHVAEAAFKAVGRALRAALVVDGNEVPSTKGRL